MDETVAKVSPYPWEFGGNGYTEVEYGHRFDCANEPGHGAHADYVDNLVVRAWSKRREGDPSQIKRINDHPVVVVKRTVTYGPWADDIGSEAPR